MFAAIGTGDRTWNGIPLPFLIPGSDSNPSGPCHVHGDVLLAVPTVAGATGAVPPFGAVPASKLSQAQGGAPSITRQLGLVLCFEHDGRRVRRRPDAQSRAT